jgi:peptide deformylase
MNEPTLTQTILSYPHPALRRKLEPTPYGPAHKHLARRMLETLYARRGIGLAAPQVGALERVCVVDVEWLDHGPEMSATYVLINPTIAWTSNGKVRSVEGCLSFPGGKAEVERFDEIAVDALDVEVEPFRLRASGLLAACLQHEIDHLDGITLVERANYIDRKALLKKARVAARRA